LEEGTHSSIFGEVLGTVSTASNPTDLNFCRKSETQTEIKLYKMMKPNLKKHKNVSYTWKFSKKNSHRERFLCKKILNPGKMVFL
jgi:hypothetical protein